MIVLLKALPVIIPVVLILILFLGGDKYFADSDGDGVNDSKDNCPNSLNPTQNDADEDNVGDECEENYIEKKMILNDSKK